MNRLSHYAALLVSYKQLGQARWHTSQPRRWLRAWLAELVGMLPAKLARRIGAGNTPQLLVWPLPARHQQGRPAVLVLQASQVMAQRIGLPLAATRNLRQVLAYEIDRYTPYSAEQVHFVARVVHRQPPLAQVELVAIARDALAQMLAACRQRDVHLVAIDALSPSGERLFIDLLPAGSGSPQLRTGLDRWLWLGCAACLVVLAAAWLDRRQHTVDAMQQAVTEQRQAVQHVQQLRQTLDSTLGASSYLATLKAQRPTLTRLLADLSACLADDTWVEQLEVRDGNQVTFSGQSAHASALLGQVKACTTLEHAQFQGIIQADKASGRERFAITAQLRQEVAHASVH
ncbi:PilN domain-containing protein [Pseudomonas sp. BP8]|uniref:PilN domain-containing protein n=1 Tax=Pseudomonas sp. BP8 TaxID=2817864 RepID=UPI001AE3FD55|nr:PilN domain-containing protein [Pseudomonas sp. BP8]MBP2262170.1 general secretion pathway protein L [Pseudomonas sp. BP8]HDS1733096.1 PilN domain-containing protein [Pseudomonas putida]